MKILKSLLAIEAHLSDISRLLGQLIILAEKIAQNQNNRPL